MSGWDRLKRALKEFAEKFDREINEAIALHIISKSQERIKKGKVKPKTSKFTLSLRSGGSGRTLIDSGNLLKSLTYKIEGREVVKIGSNLPYAKVHQFGGKIKAKKAASLCIPATKEARKKSRFGVEEALKKFTNEGWQIWFTEKAIMGRKGNKGKPVVLFYRKKQIEIPKRQFVYLTKEDEKEIAEMVASWLKE